MIKVIYSEPELKDIIESIIGKNFFIFCNSVIFQVLNELDLPARLMNQMTIIVLPHDNQEMGLAYKTLHAVKLKIQDSPEENEKTLIHETLHLIKPNWDEETTENKTQDLYKKTIKEILI